ncbi:endosome-associated-trafficking regulator 1-like [Porites lutea]
MAEGERSDNPFSFKTFVKSKQETIDVKIKKKKDKQHNSRKGEICPDESPFPEVTANKPVHSQRGHVDVNQEPGNTNPFSFKNFLSDDLASRNKHVLQIIDDEVHEVKSVQEDIPPTEEKDKDVELQNEKTTSEETDSEGTGSDTDSDSEQISSDRSPVSGSVHYFIAPLDSSRSQAMVIEELNQLKEENEKLRKDLKVSNQAREEDKIRIVSLQKKLTKIEKREADETAALENMVQMVEKNLELTTQRALRAEATVARLKEEIKILKTESVPIATYNQLLDANQCTMSAVRDKARAAADQMNAAAKNAEQAISQLLAGVDTVKFISQQLDSIDRITDVHVHSDNG